MAARAPDPGLYAYKAPTDQRAYSPDLPGPLPPFAANQLPLPPVPPAPKDWEEQLQRSRPANMGDAVGPEVGSDWDTADQMPYSKKGVRPVLPPSFVTDRTRSI